MASATAISASSTSVSISSASTMTAAVGPSISFSCSSTPDGDTPNPKRSSLRTPLSVTYPSSSLYSPMTDVKREEAAHTPLTPPSAYLDFLKNFPPSLISPVPSSATSIAFSFTGSGFKTPTSAYSTSGEYKFGFPYPQPPAATRPALSSNPSTASTGSMASAMSAVAGISAVSTPAEIHRNSGHSLSTHSASARPGPGPQTVPHAPLSAPPRPTPTSEPQYQAPAKRLSQPQRRPTLSIPPSPSLHSPLNLTPPSIISSAAIHSPSIRSTPNAGALITQSPCSAGSSPAGGPEGGKMRPVSVKQVVTRTYTYTRGPGGATTAVTGGAVEESAGKGDVDEEGGVTEERMDEGSVVGEAEQQRLQTVPLVGDVPKGKKRRLD